MFRLENIRGTLATTAELVGQGLTSLSLKCAISLGDIDSPHASSTGFVRIGHRFLIVVVPLRPGAIAALPLGSALRPGGPLGATLCTLCTLRALGAALRALGAA